MAVDLQINKTNSTFRGQIVSSFHQPNFCPEIKHESTELPLCLKKDTAARRTELAAYVRVEPIDSTEQPVADKIMPILRPITTTGCNNAESLLQKSPRTELEMMPSLHLTADTVTKSEDVANEATQEQSFDWKHASGTHTSGNKMAEADTNQPLNDHRNCKTNYKKSSLKRTAEMFIDNLIRTEMGADSSKEDNDDSNDRREIANKLKGIYEQFSSGNSAKKARIDQRFYEGSSNQSFLSNQKSTPTSKVAAPEQIKRPSVKSARQILGEQMPTCRSGNKTNEISVSENGTARIEDFGPLNLVVKKEIKEEGANADDKRDVEPEGDNVSQDDENNERVIKDEKTSAASALPDKVDVVSETGIIKPVQPGQKVGSISTACTSSSGSATPDQTTRALSITTTSSPNHQSDTATEKNTAFPCNKKPQNETNTFKARSTPVTLADYILSEFGVVNTKKISTTISDKSQLKRKEGISTKDYKEVPVVDLTEVKDEHIDTADVVNEEKYIPEANSLQTQISCTDETENDDNSDNKSQKSSDKGDDKINNSPLPCEKQNEQEVKSKGSPQPSDKSNEVVERNNKSPQPTVQPTEETGITPTEDNTDAIASSKIINPDNQRLIREAVNEFHKLVEDAMVQGNAIDKWEDISSSNNDNDSDNDLMKDTSVTTDESGNSSYNCNKCKVSFPRMTDLQMHTFTHYRKKHRCPACSKEFYNLSSVKRHMIIHTRLKPFKCPRCNRAFNLYTNLRKHFQRMHDDNLPVFSNRNRNITKTANNNGTSGTNGNQRGDGLPQIPMEEKDMLELSNIGLPLTITPPSGGQSSSGALSSRMNPPEQRAAEDPRFSPNTHVSPIQNDKPSPTLSLPVTAEVQQQMETEKFLKLQLAYLKSIQSQTVMDKANHANSQNLQLPFTPQSHLSSPEAIRQMHPQFRKTEKELNGNIGDTRVQSARLPPRSPNGTLPQYPWKSPGDSPSQVTGGSCRCLDCPHSIYARARSDFNPQHPRQGPVVPNSYPVPPPGAQLPFRQMPSNHQAAPVSPMRWHLEAQLQGQVPIIGHPSVSVASKANHVGMANDNVMNTIRGEMEARPPFHMLQQKKIPDGPRSRHFSASNHTEAGSPTSVARLPTHLGSTRHGDANSPVSRSSSSPSRSNSMLQQTQNTRVQTLDPTKMNLQNLEEIRKYFALLHGDKDVLVQMSPLATNVHSPSLPRQHHSESHLSPSHKFPALETAQATPQQRRSSRKPTELELLQRMYEFQTISEATNKKSAPIDTNNNSMESMPLDLTRKWLWSESKHLPNYKLFQFTNLSNEKCFCHQMINPGDKSTCSFIFEIGIMKATVWVFKTDRVCHVWCNL